MDENLEDSFKWVIHLTRKTPQARNTNQEYTLWLISRNTCTPRRELRKECHGLWALPRVRSAGVVTSVVDRKNERCR